jgi:hypothetical protein
MGEVEETFASTLGSKLGLAWRPNLSDLVILLMWKLMSDDWLTVRKQR